VVATCGFGGGTTFDSETGTRRPWESGSSADTIFNAQMNVSNPEKHPDLAAKVASVDTRPFFREAKDSPRAQGFHYNQNAETYMLVGESMGKAMVEMKK
jgi:alpha-galactosidase